MLMRLFCWWVGHAPAFGTIEVRRGHATAICRNCEGAIERVGDTPRTKWQRTSSRSEPPYVAP